MKTKIILAASMFIFMLMYLPLFSGNGEKKQNNSNRDELVSLNMKFLSSIDLVILEFINNKYEFEPNESMFLNFDAKKRKFFAKFKSLNIQMEEVSIDGKLFQHYYVVFNEEKTKEEFLKSSLAANMMQNFENIIITSGKMIVFENPKIAPEKLANNILSNVSNEALNLYGESYKGGILAFLDNFMGVQTGNSNTELVDLVREK